ncbi:MAG: methyltransferase [Cyclobacteriaceae bacterium]
MSAGLGRFNRIAPYYDFLKQMVFGRAIADSQVAFLGKIPKGSKLLIIGGGSGEILPVLKKVVVSPGSTIWYLEASSEMITLAAKRLPLHSRENINFIHGTENSLPDNVVFDAVLTNFFLDLFPYDRGLEICRKIYRRINPGGLWLVSDFVSEGKWWQRALLWIMYRFFAITCKIEATALPAWEDQLLAVGLKEEINKSFYRGFIKSALYKKLSN